MFGKLRVTGPQNALGFAMAVGMYLPGDVELCRRVVIDIHNQAFLTTGHCDIHFGENFGVEQRAVQGAPRVIYAVALA